MTTAYDIKHLRWKCRRGMLELDYLLLKFFDLHFEKLSSKEQVLFASLLEYPDTDLYQWLIKQQAPESKEIEQLIHLILSEIEINLKESNA